MTDFRPDTTGAHPVHPLCTDCAPAARGAAATGATALALCAALWAGPALAEEPEICDASQPGMAGLCKVIEDKCLPFLADPASVSPNDLMDVPRTFRRYFTSALSSYVIGYQETDLDRTLVVFMYDEPACEVLTYGLSYADLLPAFQAWRAGPGARFVATTGFEPTSRVTMDRAYAATFLAAPRRDGRVTEITFNWNLNFEGLTRLRVSYQPLRDHTRDLMQVEMK